MCEFPERVNDDKSVIDTRTLREGSILDVTWLARSVSQPVEDPKHSERLLNTGLIETKLYQFLDFLLNDEVFLPQSRLNESNVLSFILNHCVESLC